MGRLFGRRPDPTGGLTREVQSYLEPGEEVRVGIHAQRPGAYMAPKDRPTEADTSMPAGSGSGPPGPEALLARWRGQLELLGADPGAAGRSINVALVLTSKRLLLLRRSHLTRRVRELVLAWRLHEVRHIDAPRHDQVLHISTTRGQLDLELPQSHRFLPDVYRELPVLLAQARDRPT